jgi:hypothetical protein
MDAVEEIFENLDFEATRPRGRGGARRRPPGRNPQEEFEFF